MINPHAMPAPITLTLFARVAGPLAVSLLAYVFWRLVRSRHDSPGQADTMLVVTYIVSRVGLWLIFALYAQRYVTSSDPRLFYTPMLRHFLAGDTPIRDFFYP